MTEAEKKMKRYVNAIERRLNLPPEVKARVMSDFASSIAARREAGPIGKVPGGMCSPFWLSTAESA